MPSTDDGSVDIEPRRLTPLNNVVPPIRQSLKSLSSKKVPLKQSTSIRTCEVTFNDPIDAQLAGRFAATAIDQFMFFTNQVPCPVTRLAQMPSANDRVIRKRRDVLESHDKLVQDLQGIINSTYDSAKKENIPSTSTRIVASLGNINISKAVMLFQSYGVQPQVTISDKIDAINKVPTSEGLDLSSVTGEEPAPPDSDSDSDSDSDTSDDVAPTSTRAAVPLNVASENSRPKTPLFAPFNDEQEATKPPHSTPTTAGSAKISLLGNNRSPLQEKTIPSMPVSTVNDAPVASLTKRAKLAERDLIVGMSNMDTFVDDIDLSKIHVYIQVSRNTQDDNWHPRPALAKILQGLVGFPEVEPSLHAKLSKMRMCSVAIRSPMLDGSRQGASGVDFTEDVVWLEWDGKLQGVE
ncbi:hypothetical protein CPB86DRAFT_783870 [Serendipita vermifera]|nr:hypothetical protein CPB86DRAFT_783870 [Serendipita vermifera]